MSRRSFRLVALPVVVAVAGSSLFAHGAAAQGTANRLADGDAEAGASPWVFNGFGKVPYGAPTSPTQEAASGTSLFGSMPGNGGASMAQRVGLAERAAAIDGGTAPATVLASLGGIGDAGAQLIVQPVDGAGGPVGGPRTVGPPTAADRANETLLVRCQIYYDRLPVGTRALDVVVVSATGGGLADDLAVYDTQITYPAIFSSRPYKGRSLHLTDPQANSCGTAQLFDAQGPTQDATTAKPRLSVRTPARVRAGRTVRLRITVRNASATGAGRSVRLKVKVPSGLRVLGATTRTVGSLNGKAARTLSVRVRTNARSQSSNAVRLTVSGTNTKTTRKTVRVRVAR